MPSLSFFLILGICAGQLIKLPFWGNSGATILDGMVIMIDLYALFRLKGRFKKPPLALTLAFGFILIAVLSLILSPLKLSLSDNLVSFCYIFRFLAFTFLGYMVYLKALDITDQNIYKIIIYSGLILSILGFFQLAIYPDLSAISLPGWDPHYLRMVSTFLDPNFLGGFLVLALIPLYLSFSKYNISLLVPAKLVFSIIYLGLILTFSRSSILMFTASFLTIGLFQRSVKNTIVIPFLIAGLFFSFFLYNKLITEPRNINRQQSASYRVSSWKQGLTIFRNYPILGVGFNNYRFASSSLSDLGVEDLSELVVSEIEPVEGEKLSLADQGYLEDRSASGNDSSLLFVLSTTGIVGFLIYGLFLLSLIIKGYQRYLSKDIRGIIILSSLAGLLIHSLFVNSLFYPPILLWLLSRTPGSDVKL